MLKKCELVSGFPYINFFSHIFNRKNFLFSIKKVDFTRCSLLRRLVFLIFCVVGENRNG